MLAQHRDGVGRQADVAPSAPRLWWFYSQARLGLFQRPFDAEHATVEIDVGPLQSEQLAAPQAGGKCNRRDRVEDVAQETVEDGLDLIGRQLASTAGGFLMAATLRASEPFSTARLSPRLNTR